MGANDGGVKRGDRADTGDLEARPADGVDKGGSGQPGGGGGAEGNPTADPSALSGAPRPASGDARKPASDDPGDQDNR